MRQIHDIEYRLLPGAARQTTDIVIERDGVVSVRPPLRMTPEQVDETVFSKRMWISETWQSGKRDKGYRAFSSGWPTWSRALECMRARYKSKTWATVGPVAWPTEGCSFTGSA